MISPTAPRNVKYSLSAALETSSPPLQREKATGDVISYFQVGLSSCNVRPSVPRRLHWFNHS
jgi:hypothetical protein